MYFLYSLAMYLGLLVATPYFLLQGLRRGKNIRNIPERLGLRFPEELNAKGPGSAGAIWLHAVSVGEVLAAVPLAEELKNRYPQLRLVFSTTTETGQALARERLKFADAVFYFPLDLPGAMRRAFRMVRPQLIVVMETEIWPNFLRTARAYGAPVVYANGRISDRSFRGFQRWMAPRFRRRVFAEATMYLMQTEQDARRAIALGGPPDRVIVTGNVKYDLTPFADNPFVSWLQRELEITGRRPLVVAGSVLAGEEEPVLKAFAKVAQNHPRALLAMAPRKPERFSEAATIMASAGLRVVRRSAIALENGKASGALLDNSGERPTALLLDTLGELASTYKLADVVFVGGSLVPSGGHNPLEPAAFGRAPVFGPSMENFQEISKQFLAAKAAIQVSSEQELSAAWTNMLNDRDANAAMGQKARQLVDLHRGATAATLARLSLLLQNDKQARR